MSDLVARPPLHPPSFDKFDPQRCDDISLFDSDDTVSFRYRLTVVDHPSLLPTTKLQFATAVFLIPAGRESEYMFRTKAGLQQIATTAHAARLISIAFGRDHVFESQGAVQKELTFVVQVVGRQGNFLPPSHKRSVGQKEIPFMALDGVGKRNVIARGESSLSGSYIVEQTAVEGQEVRRLYFLANPFVIQSEVVMKNGEIGEVDCSKAAFSYHMTMAAVAIACAGKKNSHGLIVGLGGGGLVNFLRYLLPSSRLVAVELDSEVSSIACEYFGVTKEIINGCGVDIRIGDGLAIHANDVADREERESDERSDQLLSFHEGEFDFIVIDVDSKDNTVGMSCPPQAFVEVDYLKNVAKLLSSFKDGGILAINVSARDPKMLALVCERVAEVFESVVLSDGSKIKGGNNHTGEDDGDLNVVVFGSMRSTETWDARRLQEELKGNVERAPMDPELSSDLSTSIEEIVLWRDNQDETEHQESGRRKSKRGKKKGKKR